MIHAQPSAKYTPQKALCETSCEKRESGSRTMASENSDIPIMGTVSPAERKRYIRTRVITTIAILAILIIVIVVSNMIVDGANYRKIHGWQEEDIWDPIHFLSNKQQSLYTK